MLYGSSKFVKVLRVEDRAVAEVGKKVGTVLTATALGKKQNRIPCWYVRRGYDMMTAVVEMRRECNWIITVLSYGQCC